MKIQLEKGQTDNFETIKKRLLKFSRKCFFPKGKKM